MTATMLACYEHPEDPAAFDRHYAEVHRALGEAMPGLRGFTGTHPGPGPDGSPPRYYFVAALHFDDVESMRAALGGEAGKAAAADLRNFAGAGVDLLLGPTAVYV